MFLNAKPASRGAAEAVGAKGEEEPLRAAWSVEMKPAGWWDQSGSASWTGLMLASVVWIARAWLTG